MTTLTVGQQIACDTFLSIYDFALPFEKILHEIKSGDLGVTVGICDFAHNMDTEELIETIITLSERIDVIRK